MAPVTGIVVQALLAAGLEGRPVVERAVRSLVRTQQADEGWSGGGSLMTYIPPDTFCVYPGAPKHNPLLALARFRKARRAGARPGALVSSRERWSDERLDAARPGCRRARGAVVREPGRARDR
jgi:hypothetical protein